MNHQQPPGGYWPPPYQGGHPPPGGYPGYPPQIPGAPMAAATESPAEKKNTPHNDSRKDGDQAAKDPPTTTNASTDDPAKAGDEKPEASGKPAGEATPGPTPPKHMMTPMYSPYSPDPLHQHPHMPPPHAYPGYPPYPHYPPPHPHFWGPPPVRAGMPQSSDRYQSDVDGREGATSPSQIQNTHKEEVEHMGCTCKKTRCLKLYCQCFGVDLYCGNNCRCLQCCNRLDHEKFRQEAKRLILSRNPSAFDTKFKKGAADDMPEAKTLAHKQGCKCRKSGCMKKYCECYAANVKCSGNCRCIGCKNMGNTYYESSNGAPPGYPEIPVYPVPHLHPGQVMQSAARAAAASRKTELPQQQPMEAAQNLAFLKRGSPEKSGSDKENPEESVNSLMMAAYAMTEFGQGSSPSKSKKRDADAESDDEVSKRAKV